MAKSDNEEEKGGLPPKISIPIPSTRPPLDLGDADDDDDLGATMQINLDDGIAAEAAAPAAAVVEPEEDDDDLGATMQINLDDGVAAETSAPAAVVEPEEDDDDLGATMQINLDDGVAAETAEPAPATPEDKGPKLSPIKRQSTPTVRAKPLDQPQSTTMHIDLESPAEEPPAAPQVAKKSSVIRPKAPGTTTGSGSTMSIDLTTKSGDKIAPAPKADGGGDGPQPKTIKVKAPERSAGAAPRTIRVQPVGTPGSGEVTESTQQIDLTKRQAQPTAPAGAATPGGAPRTIRVKPVARGNEGQAPKSETARIPLEDALKSESGGIAPVGKPSAAPQTIRIKPKAQTPTVQKKASMAGGEKAKSETSRISLQDALASDQDSRSATAAPKTIRLKRPSEASTIKVQRPRNTAAGAAAADVDVEPEADDANTSTTRRKTIKLKRPDRETVDTGKVTLKRGAAPMDEDDGGLVLQNEFGGSEKKEVIDQPGWFFAILSFIALGVIGTTIYMFAVQTHFGVRDKSDWSFQKDPHMLWSWPQQFPHEFDQ